MKHTLRSAFHTITTVLLLTTGWCATGCYDSQFGFPEQEENPQPASQTIAKLREQYVGTPFSVAVDISVSGTVTSSDQAGNFYRSICIQEEQAAIEIMAGIDHLHNEFPIGCRVTLFLKNLTVAESRGILQVGKSPSPGSGYDTDYIASSADLHKHLVRNSEILRPLEPITITIPNLTTERCGTLIKIEGLFYLPEDLSDSAWAGYKRFSDENGNIIYTYVRSYATFAEKEVPTGTVALVGILQYDESGDGRYILKLRDENDCIR